MARILKGAPVSAALDQKTAERAAALRARGVVPTLAILRTGERSDDLSYERGAAKRCGQVGIEVRHAVLPSDVESGTFFQVLDQLNGDESIHGILMFRPLPPQLDEDAARRRLRPEKDVDGCTDGSLAGVFTNTALGFPPCTAQAAMEILRYYGVDPAGKRAAVIGRSLVVGRPAAMMLMHRGATVTICHTKTADVPQITREAEIVLAASGQMESIGAEHLRAGQTVIDVGISWNSAKGKLCGDVRFEEAEAIVDAVTPVPGGVGSVTTSVLAAHVAEAAERAAR